MWHYLILTASNDLQAAAYRQQIKLRRQLGLLHSFEHVLVVADPGGRRIGSGGSTLVCLREVLSHEAQAQPAEAARTLHDLRILIIHAGGDSRRLPAYGQCGKIFVPLPGESDSPVATTLFDRQLPVYRDLPAPPEGRGQVVITSGDVLLGFAARDVRFAPQGITGLACAAPPEQAARHGVYCPGPDGSVRRFLQKPSLQQQHDAGALNATGQALLDIGVIEFDADTAETLLQGKGDWLNLCAASEGPSRQIVPVPFSGDAANAMGPSNLCAAPEGPSRQIVPFSETLDFYREICCALGSETTLDSYLAAVKEAGSRWEDADLETLYGIVAPIPCHVHVLPRCDFLHFGTTRQIISSGQELVRRGNGFGTGKKCLAMNSRLADEGAVATVDAWVEGCMIDGALSLGGENLLVGVVEPETVELPPGACLDLLPGTSRQGRAVTFVRCYRQDDTLTTSNHTEALFCDWPISHWLQAAELSDDSLWEPTLPDHERTLWHARLFPAVEADSDYRRWLWMFEPHQAIPQQWQAWREADRYSLAEMAQLADLDAFAALRTRNQCELVCRSLRRHFAQGSGFSAPELAYVLQQSPDAPSLVAAILAEACEQDRRSAKAPVQEAFVPSRMLHTLGTAVAQCHNAFFDLELSEVAQALDRDVTRWLVRHGLHWGDSTVDEWAEQLQATAFEKLRGTIVTSGSAAVEPPRLAIRRDEIVWGRIPARLDLAGGWTDTPPYALEQGGQVLNAAVLLNGQPPIQVYGRLTSEPVIRLRSIDVGSHLEIRRWEELLDYETATGDFSLVKAALVQCGFAPQATGGAAEASLQETLANFGGGLELSTLAAIPKGSGLGTSSIMGALILAVIHRILGRELSQTELFHGVLRMEQALTTGGGWQDQVGGAAGGLKLVSAPAGFVPDTTIRYLPADILDPRSNQGCTLLYYTGITRLAKNILQEVVGRYLNRDRETMAVLERLGTVAGEMAEVISRKDLPRFGRLVDQVWQLNKRLDPNSSTPQIEALLRRARPHIWGAKLLGAGGGGFLLLVCKSLEAANQLRQDFEKNPPNDLARFFDFGVSDEGLTVTVC